MVRVNHPSSTGIAARGDMSESNAWSCYHSCELQSRWITVIVSCLQYKRMKAELSELQREWGILARTSEILREQEAAISLRLGEVLFLLQRRLNAYHRSR